MPEAKSLCTYKVGLPENEGESDKDDGWR